MGYISLADQVQPEVLVDSIDYSLTIPDSMASTPNPQDRKLRRKVGSGLARTASIVTRFKLVYYDSVNGEINYGSLSSSTFRNKIRGIRMYARFELPFLVNNSYNPTELRRIFRPKNLR